jgi:hypothetical protein
MATGDITARDNATRVYHDVFTTWYLSRKNDTVYKEMFTGEVVDIRVVKKQFEAGVRATSTEWQQKLQVANLHLSEKKKCRIILSIIPGRDVTPRSTSCKLRTVARVTLCASARRLLGGTTIEVVRQLCKFANGGRDAPLPTDTAYDTFAVPTGYRFLDYYDRNTDAQEEAWPHLRSTVLACVAMQRGTVSDLVRHLRSVDELDAYFAAGHVCGMVPLLICIGSTNTVPDDETVGRMEHAIALWRENTVCEAKKPVIEIIELLMRECTGH